MQLGLRGVFDWERKSGEGDQTEIIAGYESKGIFWFKKKPFGGGGITLLKAWRADGRD